MNLKNALLVAALSLGLVFAAGCERRAPESEKPKPVGKVLVEVNSVKITEADLGRALAKAASQHGGASVKPDDSKLRDSVLEGMINDALILDGAIASKLDVPDAEIEAKIGLIKSQLGEEGYKNHLGLEGHDEASYRALIKNTILRQRFISEKLMPVNAVTVDDARRKYKESPTPYLHPAEVQVRFIQTATFETAQAVIKELRAGAGFDDLAESLSREGKAVASAYGWTRPEMFPGEIGTGLGKIKAGSFGGPFEGKGQFYIFKVKEKKNERPKTFEEARDEIMRELYNTKRDGMVAHWLAAQRSGAKIIKH